MRLKMNRSTLGLIIILIIMVLTSVGTIHIMNYFQEKKAKEEEPQIINTFISEKLEGTSDLTTAELTYNGLIRYTEGNIPILTQKSFSMIYRAELTVAFDLSEVEHKITDTTVELMIPELTDNDVEIYIVPESIEFYDEQAALFNWTEHEDSINAMVDAKADVMEQADIVRLKAKAKQQLELIMHGMFDETIGERTLVITYY